MPSRPVHPRPVIDPTHTPVGCRRCPQQMSRRTRTRPAVEGLSKEKAAQLTQTKMASRSGTTLPACCAVLSVRFGGGQVCLQPRPSVQSVLGRRSLEPLPAVRMASSWRFCCATEVSTRRTGLSFPAPEP